MNNYELFTIIYMTLQNYKKENKVSDGFLAFLGDANPYIWQDCISGDPAIYYEYDKFIKNRKISIENSYEIAKEYIYSLSDDYYNLEEIKKAIDSINIEKWTKECKDYLSKPHKGEK